MNKEAVSDRFVGAMLGVAIGDALGFPVDGKGPDDISEFIGAVNGYLEPRNGMEPGCWSGRTQIAMTTATVIGNSVGKPMKPFMVQSHIDALSGARNWDFDTKSAVERAKSGLSYEQCGASSTTGGFLPRAIPIGLSAAVRGMNDETLLKACETMTSFTHKGRAQALATFAIAKVVCESVRRDFAGSDALPDPYHLFMCDESLFARVISFIREHELPDERSVANRLFLARRRLQAEFRLDEFVGRNGNSDNFIEATCFALFCFFKNFDTFSSIQKAVSFGRAASLNASLVGGMIGAYAGTAFLSDKKDMFDDLEGGPSIMEAGEKLLDAVMKGAE